MLAIHTTLLEVNEEFLVSEAPAEPLLLALQGKRVLTDLDLEQLRSLDAQGPRAVKRFVLRVLPLRGPLAFPAFLEALQEAKAQHLVDLLLEEEAVLRDAVKPIELPERRTPHTPQEDPNEYARKLRINLALIEDAVPPQHVIPELLHANVLSPLEQRLLHEVAGKPVLTWTILWAVLMQRGVRAYNAFMAALLKHNYSALFHTIQETKLTGLEALQSTFTRNMRTLDHNRRPQHTGRIPATPSPRPPEDEERRGQQPPPQQQILTVTPLPPGTGVSGSPSVAGKVQRRASEGNVDAGSRLFRPTSTAFSPSPPKTNPPRSTSFAAFALRQRSDFTGSSPVPSPAQPRFNARQLNLGRLASGSSRSVAANRRLSSQSRQLRPIQYSLGARQFRAVTTDDLQTEDGLRSMRATSRMSRTAEDVLYSPTWTDRFDHLRRLDAATPRLSIGLFSPAPLRQDSAIGSADHSLSRKTDAPDHEPVLKPAEWHSSTDVKNIGVNAARNVPGNDDIEKENDSTNSSQRVSGSKDTPDFQGLETGEHVGVADLNRENTSKANDDDAVSKQGALEKPSSDRSTHKRHSLASLGPEEAFNMDAIPELDDEGEQRREAAESGLLSSGTPENHTSTP